MGLKLPGAYQVRIFWNTGGVVEQILLVDRVEIKIVTILVCSGYGQNPGQVD